MPAPDPEPPPPLSYRSGPEARGDYVTTPEHRPLRNWVILVIVWIIGLAVWGFYIAMLFALFYRWFGGKAQGASPM